MKIEKDLNNTDNMSISTEDFDTRDIAKAAGISHSDLMAKVRRIQRRNGDFGRTVKFDLYFDGKRNYSCYKISPIGIEMLAQSFVRRERKAAVLALIGKEV